MFEDICRDDMSFKSCTTLSKALNALRQGLRFLIDRAGVGLFHLLYDEAVISSPTIKFLR